MPIATVSGGMRLPMFIAKTTTPMIDSGRVELSCRCDLIDVPAGGLIPDIQPSGRLRDAKPCGAAARHIEIPPSDQRIARLRQDQRHQRGGR